MAMGLMETWWIFGEGAMGRHGARWSHMGATKARPKIAAGRGRSSLRVRSGQPPVKRVSRACINARRKFFDSCKHEKYKPGCEKISPDTPKSFKLSEGIETEQEK